MIAAQHLTMEQALASAANRTRPVVIKPQVKTAATKAREAKALRDAKLAKLRAEVSQALAGRLKTGVGDGGTQV